MELQKINVKFFVAEPDQVALTVFIDVFQSWIQATDGVYYDVADYSHMNAGPGIVLVAHEANISVDETNGRRGLLYNRKQRLEGSNREKLRLVFATALAYCRRIEEEPALGGRLRFRGNEALLTINDRLWANTDETFLAIKPDVDALARQLFAGSEYSLEREQDPRKRFSLQIRSAVSFDVTALLKNIEPNINQTGGRDVADTQGPP